MAVAFYNVVNNASALLTQAYTAGDGVLHIDTGPAFGRNLPFRVTCTRQSDNARVIFPVTASGASTFTIGSPLESTTDINLAIGDVCQADITAGHFTDIYGAIISISGVGGGGGGLTGTVPIASGGTGNTVFNSGSIVFYNGSKLIDDSSNLNWDQIGQTLNITGSVLSSNSSSPIQVLMSGETIVCIGDSLVYGLGLYDHLTQAWPYRIGQILQGATVINRGVNSTTTANILTDLQNNVISPSTKSFVLLGGRNDINQGIALSTTQANISGIVNYFGSSKYLILTVPYQDDADPAINLPSTVAATQAVNNWLLSAYPGHVININTILAANADPASVGDATDVSGNITPRSLRLDGLHLNPVGNSILAQSTLQQLSVLTPSSRPLIEPKSLGYFFGSAALRPSVNRSNEWQRKQVFYNGLDSKGVVNIQGDGRGVIVDVAGLSRYAIMKLQGSLATHLRGSGLTLQFARSSSATDVTVDTTIATITPELKWSDAQFEFSNSLIYSNGDGYGVVVDNGLKRYGILKHGGFAARHIKSSGITINFATSSNTSDVTQGTYANDMVWGDGLFTYTSKIQAQGGVYVDAVGLLRYGIYNAPGSVANHVRASGWSINFLKSSNASDITTAGATTTAEMVWSNNLFDFTDADIRTANEGRGIFIDSNGLSRLGFVKKGGLYPQVAFGLGAQFDIVEWSTSDIRGNVSTGTGTSRLNIAPTTGDVNIKTGNLLFGTDNAKDIGASGTNRPRDVFVGRNITANSLIIKGSGSYLTEWQNLSGSGLSYIRTDGSQQPAHLADSVAVNDSIYYSTTQNKLCYKDSGGVVNTLY